MAHPPARVFPTLYVSSGDPSVDRLAFFHVLERLKISNPESISDHMYRMALLAMCTSDAHLDVSKFVNFIFEAVHCPGPVYDPILTKPIRCVMMCLVHDLAEAQVGDIAPREGIPKEEKQRLEAEAMHNFTHQMLHDSPAALRIAALWKEYEDGETKEAKFVKDLDRFEMALQAFEYEQRRGSGLQPFFDSSLPNIRHPEIQDWGKDLVTERHKRWHQGESEPFHDPSSSIVDR